MEEFYNFLDSVYSHKEKDDESSLILGSTFINVEYLSADKEINFIVTFEDSEDDSSEYDYKEKVIEKATELADEYEIKVNYSQFDSMGCPAPFTDQILSINILKVNKESIIDFLKKLNEEIYMDDKGYKPISRHVKFRPKARLLSILGEQLISNEIVAIKELVLNSFDAYAKNVHVNFFKNSSGKIYKIEILDDGIGMNIDNIENGWFTPATSLKTKAKKKKKLAEGERPILGEKGVGRFACRRLGEKLELRTRPKDEEIELYFTLEWSQYDVDKDDVYLDEMENSIFEKELQFPFQISFPPSLENYTNGTSIVIEQLNDTWNDAKIMDIALELKKLIPPFKNIEDFKIYINGNELKNEVFLEKALYFIEGVIDDKGMLYYKLGKYPRNELDKPGNFVNNIDFSISIDKQLSNVNGLKKENLLEDIKWKNYIKEINEKYNRRDMIPLCGNFTFAAYAWDLDSIHTKRVGINDRKSKELLRNLCGISIYRDGFRVWPYGAQGNDWLGLDKNVEGGNKPFHISNKQVIGYVGITQRYNPYLKDKSNREGFIENDFTFSDFKMLLMISFNKLERLRYVTNKKERPVKDKEWWERDEVLDQLKEFKVEIEKTSPQLLKNYNKLEKVYNERKKQSENKIMNLLEVSSSGVVFESVTHELISFLTKMDEQSKLINKYLTNNPPEKESAMKSNTLLYEALKIVLHEVKELQPYFKAARYHLKELDMKDVAEKALTYFKYKLHKNNINYSVIEKSSMKRKAVEGFLLQIFSNLIDNSIYWLDDDENKYKQILITIDGENNYIYFSDNGCGINEENIPYVFDPFFTQKKNGRGMGLYIVQELLANYKGTIYADTEYHPNLKYVNNSKGTTFKIILP